MNITLVGYGKMGKAIENVAIKKGDAIIGIVDPVADGANFKKIESINKEKTDCVIDFSHPSCAIDNIKFYIENDIKAIIGTTGWYDKIDKIKALLKPQSAIMYSGNFSIGVAVFLEIIKKASAYMDKLLSYDASIYEIHHNQKADSPSGTAIMVADCIKNNLKRKDKVIYGNSAGKINPNELQISSIRLGSTFGVHSAMFDSEEDTIEIKHTAKTRNGFAKGAVDCAHWIFENKKQGLLTLDEYIKELI